MARRTTTRKKTLPRQHQDRQPGLEAAMTPPPASEERGYKAAAKLKGKTALISGGDSGIGRATAIAFAKEGADVAIMYYDEHRDARKTRKLVEQAGTRCLLISGDIADEKVCRQAVKQVVKAFGRLDILVNNAGEQHTASDFTKITPKQLERTFRTNVFGMFHLTRAALPQMKDGSAIINTTSVTAYRGSGHLVDYAASKGAIVGFTRSLAKAVADKGIRVNAVAPGPIWTPLIPASFRAEHVEEFGADVPLGRPGQPDEVAPSYVFLASEDASYMTGQVLHPNGGEAVAS